MYYRVILPENHTMKRTYDVGCDMGMLGYWSPNYKDALKTLYYVREKYKLEFGLKAENILLCAPKQALRIKENSNFKRVQESVVPSDKPAAVMERVVVTGINNLKEIKYITA